MVEVHVRQHHVGHGGKIDAGGFHSMDELSGPREIGILFAETAVDEDRLVAAAHDNGVQGPIEGNL